MNESGARRRKTQEAIAVMMPRLAMETPGYVTLGKKTVAHHARGNAKRTLDSSGQARNWFT
jgi:hypothetical protein